MSKPNWDEIRREWETTKKTYKELEEQFNVKSSTIRSRKNREKWERNATTKKRNTVATKKKNVATKKRRKEPIELSDELTDMQKAFCFNYINSFNATQSAIKAGYSKGTAHVQGSRLLRNVKVAEEIRRLRSEMQGELFIDATDLTKEYMKMAFADITDFVEFGKKEVPIMTEFGPLVDDNGEEVTQEVNYIDFLDSDLVDGRLISEVKQGRDGVSVKLHDKQKAMNELNKRLLSIDELNAEKIKAETELTNLRAGQIKGETKDTSLLDALTEGRKKYEQMMKERESNE